MMTPNPLEGIGFHGLGAASAATCYLPYHKTRGWSWTAFWLVQAVFAWIITPLVLAVLTVPDFFSVLQAAPASVLWITFLLGACYGFGGMSFGFATRYIGYSLTYTISIGLSAVLGTVLPLLMKGGLISYFAQRGGGIILTGMIISLVGVSLCGWAGFRKEKESQGDVRFNMRLGLALTIVAGILSAVFNIALEYGQPIADIAARHGAGIFEDNAKLVVATSGCFIVNFVWFLILGYKEGNLQELGGKGVTGTGSLARNFLWSSLGGILWCMQFFFYGLGHVKMGKFKFASWVIHMSMLIFFSFLVGMMMKEWRSVSRPTYRILILALCILCLSFCIMTWGSMLGGSR